MMQKWREWMKENGKTVLESYGAGKTKTVKQSGIADFRNEIMVINIASGEDRESVSKLFANHPHLEIPNSWIEITELNEIK
jgi:vacuolar-type H+-ATPase catalytic subunit A/Vma1